MPALPTPPTVPWPPADTDRNRILFRAGAVVAVLATVYGLLWAMETGAFVPWAMFFLGLAASVVLGTALLLMRESRRRGVGADADPATSGH